VPVPRSIWIDDSGSGLDGTVLNNAELQKIYDNIDLEVNSANFPSITAKSLKDGFIAAGAFYFGGDAGRYRRTATFPAGAAYDILAPGTGVWRVDPAHVIGTWKLEVVLRAEPGAPGGTAAYVGLFNLTDTPDTAIDTLSTTSQTGARLLSVAGLALGAGGVAKDYGLKIRSSDAGWGVNLVWARIARTG
jgi:hypothetical protein